MTEEKKEVDIRVSFIYLLLAVKHNLYIYQRDIFRILIADEEDDAAVNNNIQPVFIVIFDVQFVYYRWYSGGFEILK